MKNVRFLQTFLSVLTLIFLVLYVKILSTGKMLLEHETMKLKEQEETYTKELKEWKALLKPRKQVTSIS